MEASILIAQIFAVVYLAICLGVVFNWKKYQQVILDLLDNTGYLVVIGMIAVALGIWMISYFSIWNDDWTVAILALGWIAVLKGVLILAFPSDMTIYRPFITAAYSRWVILAASISAGVFFAYYGFFT